MWFQISGELLNWVMGHKNTYWYSGGRFVISTHYSMVKLCVGTQFSEVFSALHKSHIGLMFLTFWFLFNLDMSMCETESLQSKPFKWINFFWFRIMLWYQYSINKRLPASQWILSDQNWTRCLQHSRYMTSNFMLLLHHAQAEVLSRRQTREKTMCPI